MLPRGPGGNHDVDVDNDEESTSTSYPGVPNWLDTAGYPRGVVQGRWTGCESQPIPSVKKVMLTKLRNVLPPGTPFVTPALRQTQIGERRLALQQRPLW
jgi:hypothetical protein